MIRSIRHTLLRRQEMFPVAIIGGSRTWSSFVTTSTTGTATTGTVKRILSRPRQTITSTAYINRNYFTGTSTNGTSSSSCCCCAPPPPQPTSDSSRPTTVFHRTYHSPFPVSILLPPQQQQQRQPQQQQRHFGKGLQQRKHGKKHGYTNDETKLQICYSDYDLQLDEEEDDFDEELQDMTFVKVKFHLSNIKETVEEIFDDSRQIQYYDGLKKQWRPLTDLSTIHMQQYRGGKQVLKVRVPEHYDDTPMGKERDDDDNDDETFRRFNIDSDDENDEEDDGYGDDDGTKKRKREQKRKNKMHRLLRADALQIDFAAMFLEGMIKGLVTKLKTAQYVRCNGIIYGENNLKINVYSMIHTETNEKILTKEYVLQEASTNRDLSRLLLAVSGSLDHIVRCIHYNLLWEHQDRPKRMHNGAIIRNE